MGFYSLQIARTGLVASQKALDVIGHNVANANTPGYTRQRLELSAQKGTTASGVTVGAGVNISDVKQIRNQYLDYQFRNENGVNAELLSKSEAMTYIENIFGEPSDYGINQSLSDFFVSMEELTYNAHDSSYRETVVQNAVKLTDSIRTVAGEMISYQKEIDRSIEITVDQVNGILDQIKDLNVVIFDYEARGSTANDLRDQRNQLIDELSAYIDIDAFENMEGQLVINAAGTTMVHGEQIRKIDLEVDTTNLTDSGEPLQRLIWAGTNSEVKPQAGALKGYLDVRDGLSQEAQGIPYYMNRLNRLANDLITGFNAINQNGYTIPYGNEPSQTGIVFFDSNTDSALNIRVSDALLESGYNIALSDQPITGELNWGNSQNGLNFTELRDKDTIMVGGNNLAGNFEKDFRKTITDMAINKNYFDSRSNSQQELTSFIESQKLAISEVSIDEEMVSMVQFQHAYSASARLVTVVDEMLSTLINMVR